MTLQMVIVSRSINRVIASPMLLMLNRIFGFQIIKNLFETSHAKGVQDAAGDLVTKPIWRWVIHNADIVYDFWIQNLCSPIDNS